MKVNDEHGIGAVRTLVFFQDEAGRWYIEECFTSSPEVIDLRPYVLPRFPPRKRRLDPLG